ncbi:hypothetical protein CIPAW_08G116000 [Carya illinoinensis]|uniref:Uncharacterized protein n=1 Tax=Carya illinoinensis TaxID=32201 RepID=A0A8T1PQP6_CARIL|nr:hypothetical protein CIPAW_08G116000 [Carya illinoinensis]
MAAAAKLLSLVCLAGGRTIFRKRESVGKDEWGVEFAVAISHLAE